MKLQRLNMDNSWFLQLGDARILIDPWLEGAEIDYFRWFNTQWHRTAPLPYARIPEFDAVLLTQKYPDHFHPQTLQQLNPKTILASDTLNRPLRNLLPDANRLLFTSSTPTHHVGGVAIRHIPSPRSFDPIYDAFLLDDGTESAFVATHGFAVSEVPRTLIEQHSPCKLLLNPFNRYVLPAWLGGVITPGLETLRNLSAHIHPTYIAQTHDEPKNAKGLVSMLARVDAFQRDTLSSHPWLTSRYLATPDYTPIEL